MASYRNIDLEEWLSRHPSINDIAEDMYAGGLQVTVLKENNASLSNIADGGFLSGTKVVVLGIIAAILSVWILFFFPALSPHPLPFPETKSDQNIDIDDVNFGEIREFEKDSAFCYSQKKVLGSC